MRAALPFILAIVLAGPAAAQTLLVGNKGENTLGFLDLRTGREVARVATGPMPHEIAVSPDGKQAAVVAYGGNTIDLFDVASATKLETIDLGTNQRPHGLVWLSDGRLVASTEGSDTIVVVRVARQGAGPRVRSFGTGGKGSHMVVVGPHRRIAYVANMRSGTVSMVDIDGRSATETIAVGGTPEGIALSPDGRTLWVADLNGARVQMFDTRTGRKLGEGTAGKSPIRIAVAPNGKRAFISNAGEGTLSVYDAGTLKPADTITVSGQAEAAQVTILISADGKRLYAAETGRDQIAEVELATGKVLRRLPAGKNGDGLAISPLTVAAK
jgi:YVTN family beta-propeller protein